MEPDIIQTESFYRAWAWAEKNKKQLSLAIAAIVVIGLVVYFITWQKEEKQLAAGQELSKAFVGQMMDRQAPESIDAYQRVVKEYPNSKAAARAALLTATAYFDQGKYDQSHSEFQKFARENTGSPFMAQAMLGIASSLEAQGNTDKALEAYQNVVERYPGSPVLSQARFSLARLREAKGETERALTLYEEVGRDNASSLANEAGMRAEEIKIKHPDLAAKVQAAQKLTTTMISPTPTNSAAPKAKK